MTPRRSADPREMSTRTKWVLGGLLVLVVVALLLSALDARGVLDDTKDPLALRPGDCIELTGGGGLPSDVPVVACTERHDGEVVGMLGATAARSDRSPADLCLETLDDYADPELLALTRVDPAIALRAVPVRLPQKTDEVWRCVLDVRESAAEPRSVQR